LLARRGGEEAFRARSGAPWPLVDELSRPHPVRRLAARWTNPVTLVLAGHGFWKSTLLAQAKRVSLLEPAGVEAWVGCQAGDDQADHLPAKALAAPTWAESGFEAEIEGLRLRHPTALVTAGEPRFGQGDVNEALANAERALTIDPYLEHAHRLAIAASLQGHRTHHTSVAIARARDASAELGVEPEPATRMLVRQAARLAEGRRAS